MASGWSAWTISERMLASRKARSRCTRQTMLRGPNRPSSAGRSATARSKARATGSRGSRRAISICTAKTTTGLRQDLLPVREVLDRLRADLLEASVQALAQDAGARRGRVQPRHEDEVGPLLVELERLGDVVGGEDDSRIGRLAVDGIHQ